MDKPSKVRETDVERAARMIAFDNSFGYETVCGVDEAGRGPLAGPVSVCACIMPSEVPLFGVDDSKKLNESKREKLYEDIIRIADYCLVFIDRETIDRINILEATKLGMKRAVEGLKEKPDFAIVDAVKGLDISVPYAPIVKGDANSYSVAVASIIAKVARDRLMRRLDEEFPMYGFAKNKGYGTAAHIEALKKYGATAEHRRSFIGNFIDVSALDGENAV